MSNMTRERLTRQAKKEFFVLFGHPSWPDGYLGQTGAVVRSGKEAQMFPSELLATQAAKESGRSDWRIMVRGAKSNPNLDQLFGLRAAADPTGLYGSTRAVQRAAEIASRKLARHALKVAKRIFAKDADVVSFLQAHAKREGSKSAKVILAAMKEVGPKVAAELRGGVPKSAGAAEYGLYGFKARTAELGMDACKDIRLSAGRIAAELHQRKSALHGSLTGFFKEHSKQAGCAYAGMMLACYPDATSKVASTQVLPPDGHDLVACSGSHSVTVRGRVRDALDVVPWRKGASSSTEPPFGRLSDVEVLPSDLQAFSLAVQASGREVSDVSFVSSSKDIHVAGTDADGTGMLLASFKDEQPAIVMPVTYTASYAPVEKTVLASGDWIEWE